MFRLVSNIVVFIAIVMWSIIILTFLVITIYNKVNGKAIKKSDKATTQDLTVQSHVIANNPSNIDYEEVRKKDVENIVNSESSDNSEKNCKTENNKPKSNKSKSTLIL